MYQRILKIKHPNHQMFKERGQCKALSTGRCTGYTHTCLYARMTAHNKSNNTYDILDIFVGYRRKTVSCLTNNTL